MNLILNQRILLFPLFFLLMGQTVYSSQFGLNDVSILFSIPKTPEERDNDAITARSQINGGRLLPVNLLKKADLSNLKFPQQDVHEQSVYEKLIVVGLRLDHCFRDTFKDRCQPQIRLVLQPLNFDSDDLKPKLADVSLHLFFNLSEQEFFSMAKQIRNERNKYRNDLSFIDEPLTTHPILKSQGLSGPYFVEIKKIVLSHLRSTQLSRIAFHVADRGLFDWLFKSFDVKTEKLSPVKIPDIQSTSLIVSDSAGGGINQPLPQAKKGTDQVFDAFHKSRYVRNDNTDLIKSIERIESPTSHLPGTIDCVSCHSTSQLKNELPYFSNSPFQTAITPKTIPKEAMRNITQADFNNVVFRLFGYTMGKPTVGQRTINETAQVVDYLNSNTPLSPNQ